MKKCSVKSQYLTTGSLFLTVLSTLAAGEKESPFHLEGRVREVGQASFRTHSVKHSHVQYADARALVSFSHYVAPKNTFTWKLGYNYLKFDWEKNPRFSDTEFHYAIASLTYITKTLEDWRWIVDFGISVDTEDLAFSKTAVYHGLVWGRFQQSKQVGIHAGFFSYGGFKNGYVLPVVGVDWKPTDKWKIQAIFPIDLSLRYQFATFWSTKLAYDGFGGPYRFPRRAHHGKGRYHDPIFEIYASGIEWGLEYNYRSIFEMGAGIGWNYGGWILIKDSENRHRKYFKFDGAPYAEVHLELNF